MKRLTIFNMLILMKAEGLEIIKLTIYIDHIDILRLMKDEHLDNIGLTILIYHISYPMSYMLRLMKAEAS